MIIENISKLTKKQNYKVLKCQNDKMVVFQNNKMVNSLQKFQISTTSLEQLIIYIS